MKRSSLIILLFLSLFYSGCEGLFDDDHSHYLRFNQAKKTLMDSILTIPSFNLERDIFTLKKFEKKYVKKDILIEQLGVDLMYADIYRVNSQPYTSLEYYQNAISLALQLKQDSIIGIIHFRMGQNYGISNQNKDAFMHNKKAIAILSKFKNEKIIGLASNNIGLCLIRNQSYKEAIHFFNKALVIFQKQHSHELILSTYNNLGHCYIMLKDYKKAEHYLITLYQLMIRYSTNYSFSVENLLLIAKLKFYKKSYHDSLIDLNKAFTTANKNNNIYELNKILKLQYEIYYYLKQYKKALDIKKNNERLEAQLNEQEKNKTIDAIKLKFLNQKQAIQNRTQQNELQNQQKVFLLFIIIGILLIGFIVVQYKNYRKLNLSKSLIEKQNKEIAENEKIILQINSTLEEKIKVRTKELEDANSGLIAKNKEIEESLLKGQTIERKRVASELHDGLGSHLSALSWSMMMVDTDKFTPNEAKVYASLQRMIQEVYEQVRNIAHSFIPDELEKNGLKKAIEKYFYIIQLQNKVDLRFFINIDRLVQKNIEFELYNIIMEYINNILKHSKASFINILILKKENSIIMTIENDGVYFDVTIIEQNKGKGIRNIADRVKSVGGTWKVENNHQELDKYHVCSNFEFKIFI